MVLVSFGKYKGKDISELLRDRRYVDWIMTTWSSSEPLYKLIKNTVDDEKRKIKAKYPGKILPEFVYQWLAMSYEGYKVCDEDIKWVQELLKTDKSDITLTFVNHGFVFKVGEDMFALQPMEVKTASMVYKALRHEIQDQISYYRTKQFHNRDKWTCEETGRTLYNDEKTHVDHHFRKKTFLQLAHEFFSDINDIEIEYCGMYYRLKDRTQAKEWSDYHQSNAILRLIHESANTNPEYYLQKYPEPPYAPKPKPKQEKIPLPTPKFTFDSFLAKEPTP
jgi:hypothetical protein